MGGVFRRRGRARWHYKLRFPDGTWRTRVGYTDKRATEAKQAQEQSAIDRGEVGLLDPFAATRKATLPELAQAYGAALRARACVARHVELVLERLSLVFRATGARHLPELEPAAVETFLARLLRGDGDLPPMRPRKKGGKPVPRRPASMRTRDAYVEALRAFGVWLHETDRWGNNPFARLKKQARESDRTMTHRAITREQLEQVVAAAPVRGVQQYVRTHPRASAERLAELEAIGWARGTLYLWAAWTGLRLSECRAVRRADLVLEGDEPHVVVRSGTAKNRTEQKVPLLPWVVDRLREHLARTATAAVRAARPIPDGRARVFEVRRGLLAAFRKDAEWVGLGLYDDAGHRLTFHGLRACTATLLVEAEVSVPTAMRVLRHSSADLTIKVYAKLRQGHLHRELLQKLAPPVAPKMAPNETPLRAAVGSSVQFDPQPPMRPTETEPRLAAGNVAHDAALCSSLPGSFAAAARPGDGGSCSQEARHHSGASRVTTGPPPAGAESGTTGGTKDRGRVLPSLSQQRLRECVACWGAGKPAPDFEFAEAIAMAEELRLLRLEHDRVLTTAAIRQARAEAAEAELREAKAELRTAAATIAKLERALLARGAQP